MRNDITTLDSEEHTSVRVVPGFAKRLDEVFEFAGFRAYGRLKVVCDYTGLSYPGVKKMYADDRPPRPKPFERLIDNLIKAIEDVRRVSFTRQRLRDFLLLNKGRLQSDFSPSTVQTPAVFSDTGFDIAEYLREDPVYTSQVIIRIEELAKEAGIDTSSDITSNDMKLIQFRIVSYCHKNRPQLDSEKVGHMVTSLFELAMQDLL